MFTGLIETVGKIKEIKRKRSKLFIGIKIHGLKSVNIGDSISCNGVCSTVTDIKKEIYYFEYMKETLEKSYFNKLKINEDINIERSLKANDRLDGHFVQGHVDEVGTIQNINKTGENINFEISFSSNYKNFIIKKGSIAVDGISLTVAELSKRSFTVGLISHTYKNTNFKNKSIGDPVNLEYDLLGKYIYRFYENKTKNINNKDKNLREVLKKW